MKKNLIAKITTLSLVCVLGVGSVTALALNNNTEIKDRIVKTNFVNKDNLTDEQKSKHDAFYNSLTEEQKTEFESLFARKERAPLTDEQKAEFEAKRAQQEAKHDAFYESLTSEQKALYDASRPAKPADGERPTKPTKEQMETMKQNRDAFINSLTEEQKAEFESLFNKDNFKKDFDRNFDRGDRANFNKVN